MVETINEVFMLLKETIPTSINMNIQIEKDNLMMILGNQTHLHQVIMNIVNNAVDAMGGEGQLDIHLYEISPDDQLFRENPNVEAGTYFRVDITDTGHGIDEATLERIFEPFFTTKEVGKGTGLGLATAHAIMKEHNGEILVESELGKGTTFSLLIPSMKKGA